MEAIGLEGTPAVPDMAAGGKVGRILEIAPNPARDGTGVPAVVAHPASRADVPRLLEFMQAYYAEAGFAFDRSWARGSFTTLLDDPSSACVRVLHRGNVGVGYFVLTFFQRGTRPGSEAVIEDLFVCPWYRHQRAGTAAMLAALAECRARQVADVHVQIVPNDPGIRNFYGRFGLEARADRRHVLTATLDAACPSA